MDKNNALGEILEKGQTVVKNSGKAVVNSAAGMAKAAAGQVAGDANQSGSNEANTAIPDQEQVASDKAQTEELVKDLYAPSKPQSGQKPVVKPQSETEEKAKLASVRQKLHDEVYYQPLIQGQKSQQEERPTEKAEREKEQGLQDLQKKEAKKPAPIAVQRAQQTAEKFRGVSG
jgi:hypothetical protein